MQAPGLVVVVASGQQLSNASNESQKKVVQTWKVCCGPWGHCASVDGCLPVAVLWQARIGIQLELDLMCGCCRRTIWVVASFALWGEKVLLHLWTCTSIFLHRKRNQQLIFMVCEHVWIRITKIGNECAQPESRDCCYLPRPEQNVHGICTFGCCGCTCER